MDASKTIQRTAQQNKAIHVLFEMISRELNNHGMYIANVIKADIPWNPERVKELLWRETQKKMFGKESTTELTTAEIDQVFEVIHRGLSELGLDITFPRIEEVQDKLKK